MLVVPIAVRIRGLYLGIVTIGLVFIGLHLAKVFTEIAGAPEVGRDFPPLEFKWWKEEDPVISFDDDGHWLWFDISGAAKTYLFCLALLGHHAGAVEEPHPHPHRARAAGDPRPRRGRRDHGSARDDATR